MVLQKKKKKKKGTESAQEKRGKIMIIITNKSILSKQRKSNVFPFVLSFNCIKFI